MATENTEPKGTEAPVGAPEADSAPKLTPEQLQAALTATRSEAAQRRTEQKRLEAELAKYKAADDERVRKEAEARGEHEKLAAQARAEAEAARKEAAAYKAKADEYDAELAERRGKLVAEVGTDLGMTDLPLKAQIKALENLAAEKRKLAAVTAPVVPEVPNDANGASIKPAQAEIDRIYADPKLTAKQKDYKLRQLGV